MKQTSKEKYLSQKGITVKTRDKARSTTRKEKKPLSSFEKLVLFLLLLFLVASPLAFWIRKDIIVYVGLFNYLILGLAITLKPEMVIDIMRKNNLRFEEIYGQKIATLKRVIRSLGLLFVGVGAILYYFIFPQA